MSKKFNATESLRYKGVATFLVVARPQIGVSRSQWISKKYILRGSYLRC